MGIIVLLNSQTVVHLPMPLAAIKILGLEQSQSNNDRGSRPQHQGHMFGQSWATIASQMPHAHETVISHWANDSDAASIIRAAGSCVWGAG